MTLKIVFRRAAARDLRDARDWYDEQRPGLGDEFVLSVEAAVELIQRMPNSYQVVEPTRSIRRVLAHRFPYAIYYVVENQRIVVLAALHVARDPTVWQGRK